MNILDIKRANAAKGFHFFDKNSMAFFNSKIEGRIFEGSGGVFFVTSEAQDMSHARMFTVRNFNSESGEVKTVGKFCSWFSLREAMDKCKHLAKEV
jgi:hypothetical protein